MNLQNDLQLKDRFLEEFAEQCGFFDARRQIFKERFAKSNERRTHIQLIELVKEKIEWDEDLVESQKFQDELSSIINELKKKGCPIKSSGRGKPKKGKEPWRKAYNWLWEDKFPKWQGEQNNNVIANVATINWHDISLNMLKKKLLNRASTNHLMHDELAKKEIEEIYVPLALVSKKKPDKHKQDNLSPDAGTGLYQPKYETTQPFEHNDFLSRILKEREGKSQGKRIALIGEPGAGKTTLLQTIASWILKQELGFPIWISLADLVREENVTEIETYISDTWLKQAVSSELTAEIQTDFRKQIEQQKVWLLLDGVDEMLGGKASCQPLAEIARQLTGWINSSRVVLTCRLNVWQADSNALENFETYRLLDFDDPQVFAFIKKCFKLDIEKGKRLKTELDRAERRRLQDLVKNPLRLFLLCSIWQEEEGNLPETKAGLYGRYRRYMYSWKQQKFPITRKQQDKLDSALGRLAWRDLNQGSSRFRMREDFIVKELGYPDDENSYFYQALKIGWLNHVGYAAESASKEKVYAFYHATFEEYFAALAVESGDDFLHHVPNYPETGTYRIFEPEWREVILLWLGREDVDDEAKNQFIKSLKEFPSECGDFYSYRAYFLAAAAIAEWENYPDAKEIVEQTVRWGYLGTKSIIPQEARKALSQTEPKKAIKFLSDLLADKTLNNFTRRQVATSLGQIGSGNQEAIQSLSDHLADKTLNNFIRRQVATSLGQIGSGNQEAIQSLSGHLADQTLDNYTRMEVATSLWEIDPGNREAIESLSDLLADRTLNNTTRMEVGKVLKEIDPGNQKAIESLSDLLADQTLDNYTRMEVATSLWEIDPGNRKAIESLSDQLADQTLNNTTRRRAAELLGRIGSANQEAIESLSDLLADDSLNNKIRYEVAASLGQIDPGNREAIESLSDLLADDSLNNKTRYEVAASLGQIDPGNQKAIESLSDLLADLTLDYHTHWHVAKLLGRIDPGNQKAIESLSDQLADQTLNNYTRRRAAEFLREIDPGNQKAIESLSDQLANNTLDNHIRMEVAKFLREIDPGNQKAIESLSDQLADNTLDNHIRRRAAELLGKIDPGNSKGIKFLSDLLADQTLDNFTRCQVALSLKYILTVDHMPIVIAKSKNYSKSNANVYELIWNCAQVLPYLKFYRAWNNA